MRNKVLAALVAGGLLVGAGFLTSVISSPSTAAAQEDDGEERRGPIPRILGFLGGVLDELVGEGTITQDQADAIISATDEHATELEEQVQANRELLREMLEDGVITEEEASDLPDDHFLFSERFDEAWEDGELSAEDLRGLRPFRRHPFRFGFHLGGLADDGGIDQDEYDDLPDDHILKQTDVSPYLEDDGLITPDEFREIFPGLRDIWSDDDDA